MAILVCVAEHNVSVPYVIDVLNTTFKSSFRALHHLWTIVIPHQINTNQSVNYLLKEFPLHNNIKVIVIILQF